MPKSIRKTERGKTDKERIEGGKEVRLRGGSRCYCTQVRHTHICAVQPRCVSEECECVRAARRARPHIFTQRP